VVAAAPPSRFIVATLGVLAALAAGVLASQSPKLAVVAAGAIILVPLALAVPAPYLIATLLCVAIVPYDLQHRFSGHGSGLVLVDVMLVLGLAWAVLTLARQAVDARARWTIPLLGLFLALMAVQAILSWRRGQAPGDVLLEFRQTFAICTLIIAVPLLSNPEHRRTVFKGLVIAVLILGLWGLAQWVLHAPGNSSEDFGVSTGVQLTTNGTGKLLGGRYIYPAVVIMTFAALTSATPRPRRVTVALLAALLLNTIDLLLTFERAFWLATIFALLLVVFRSGRAQRARAVVWGGAGILLVTGLLSVVAPSNLSALRERLISVGQYHSDTSVTYRLVESRYVLRAIEDAPLRGQGLGASVYWGIPSLGIPPTTKTYSHNAYLRIAWKVGIPLALLLLGIIVRLLFLRRPADPQAAALHNGAQAGLIALLIMAITGPIFSTLSAMAVIGMLGAIILVPGPAIGPGQASGGKG
jgi:O-antigen ligase